MELIGRVWAALRRMSGHGRESSPAVIEMLTALEARGGYVGDHEPFADAWADALVLASRLGLVNPGSGLDAGWWLTPKGKQLIAEREAAAKDALHTSAASRERLSAK